MFNSNAIQFKGFNKTLKQLTNTTPDCCLLWHALIYLNMITVYKNAFL